MEKQVLLVDDEAYMNKCKKILEYLEGRGVSYDIAVTLEEAIEKVLSVSYDGIILDQYFPFKEGEDKKSAAKRFLEILDEQGKKIPVIVYSTSLEPIKHELVIENTNPLDFQKMQKMEKLLNYEKIEGTKKEEKERD